MLVYGLKGIGAYYHHAAVLGYTDDAIEEFLERGPRLDHPRPLRRRDGRARPRVRAGSGVATLALLDRANTATYGDPGITSVKTTVGNRPGILITGHDLKDLAQLLEQSKDAGIDVYTHGEMLPAHAYPAFKKYPHLVGNYGSSWHHQREEFEAFNGPVLVTTNCIIPPKESYLGRIYTTGPAGWPGVIHIPAGPDGIKDFSAIIKVALSSLPPSPLPGSGRDLVTGCAHKAVLALAGTIVEAVKKGDINRFVVMAGCDGRQREREYYTEFAEALPPDTVILTAGCAKYRYNALDLGTIGGIPRVIDAGQCNDCYSLVVIAQALAAAFGVGINDLPISFNIAWYEQKAVLVLLALLSLGVKNITLGPTLPGLRLAERAESSRRELRYRAEHDGRRGSGPARPGLNASTSTDFPVPIRAPGATQRDDRGDRDLRRFDAEYEVDIAGDRPNRRESLWKRLLHRSHRMTRT